MSRRPSTQTNKFNATATADIPRSSFDLSHGSKTTLNSNDLVPIFSMECLPGDSISLRATLFGRIATLIKPILDNLHCETFFFFTPTRQLWDHWVHFNGEQESPEDTTEYLIPQIDIDPSTTEDLYDYYGLPVDQFDQTVSVNVLPFRAYEHIYRNWFRDQNLIASTPIDTGDGPHVSGDFQVRTRRKRKDYFTGCLPWPQKHADVTVNLGGNAFIEADVIANGSESPTIGRPGDALVYAMQSDAALVTVDTASGDLAHQMYANLENATGISINDLRESIQIQKLFERDARGGTRYPELLRAHFGVSDPMMLVHQRPVFLGGGHTMVNISPIAQMTQTTVEGGGPNVVESPQANLAAYGTIQASNHGFTYSATEHGYITGIVNIRADLTYQQGIERYWWRQTRFDFFYPALGHLGEMAVLNRELYCNGGSNDDLVFGYQEAWADYRYIPSKISGLFRSTASASLDVWHLAQDFASAPLLNAEFIEEDVPMDRVVAVPAEPDFLLDIYFKIKAARPLPLYGTPGLMDHF